MHVSISKEQGKPVVKLQNRAGGGQNPRESEEGGNLVASVLAFNSYANLYTA